MQDWEYKVIPAPTKGQKAKGARSAEERFAHAIEVKLNEMAAEGWTYERAEMLPSQERSGLTGSSTQWRNLLIFKRPAPLDEMPEIVATLPPPTADLPEEPTLESPPEEVEKSLEKREDSETT